MDKVQIAWYHSRIILWRETKEQKERNKIRNEIFINMEPYMEKWISSILANKKIYWSHEEIRSKSWDYFLACLLSYKPEKNIPVPNHFYSYTRFYIANDIAKKEPNNNSDDIDGHPEREKYPVYDHLQELLIFRGMLSPPYDMIFDDSVMSMVPNRSDRVAREKETGIGYHRYHEAKKIFKVVVQFLLLK